MLFDTVWLDARLATLRDDLPGLGIVDGGAVAARDGRIVFAGREANLPSGWDARERVRLDGRLVTPGLVDCHTHLVYAGSRAREFEMRLAGVSLTRRSPVPAAASRRPSRRRGRRASTNSSPLPCRASTA